MRCPTCGANNDAERLFCVSCAAELVRGAGAAVEPPRARDRRTRQVRAVSTGFAQAWDRALFTLERNRPHRAGSVRALRRLLIVLASLVPGLAHLLLGHRRMGLGLLAGFSAAALIWFALMGTPVATLMATVAVSLLLTSVLDGLRLDPATGERGRVDLAQVMLAVAIVGGCYTLGAVLLAARWERVTVMQPIVRLSPPPEPGVTARGAVTVFGTGDRILFARSAYRRTVPARGDVVLVRADDMINIERILAIPGDSLEYHRGMLYLNGEALAESAYPVQPLVPFEIHGGHLAAPEWSGQAREGEYLGWGIQYPAHDQVGMGPVTVRKDSIRGKGWLVYSPYWRRRLIDHLDPAAGVRQE